MTFGRLVSTHKDRMPEAPTGTRAIAGSHSGSVSMLPNNPILYNSFPLGLLHHLATARVDHGDQDRQHAKANSTDGGHR